MKEYKPIMHWLAITCTLQRKKAVLSNKRSLLKTEWLTFILLII